MIKIMIFMLISIFSTAQAATTTSTTKVTVKTSDVKVLWCSNCSKTTGLDERSTLENYTDWYFSMNASAKTSIYKMVLDGWTLSQIVPAGVANQFYVIFTK